MQTTTGENAGHAVKVMVVDDSMTIRRTAETLLSGEGYVVITAENGFEALAKIVDHHPDIIFLDITMPRLDGYQTCSVIKNNRRFQEIPVVMLSNRDSIFDKARGRLAGSVQFITKPFTKDDLLQAIQHYVPRP